MTFEILAEQQKSTRYDSLASSILQKRREIRKEFVRDSFCGLAHVEHKQEFVASIQGIDFINDSISSTINSTWFAMDNFRGPVIWIAGGVESRNDYDILIPLVRTRVKAIICLGVNNDRLHEAFSALGIPMTNAGSMEAAVQQAYQLGEKGDVVLLSPACASFDLFKNFEERGNAFRSVVKNL